MNSQEADIEFDQETYRSMIQLGTLAIKFCGTVNGGAILALLTFVGHTYKVGVKLDVTWPFIIYSVGLTLAGFATMATYFVQKDLYDNGQSVQSFSTAISFIVSSTLCFLTASIWAAIKISIS